MRDNLDWWGPTWAALSCILDMMPSEQRVADSKSPHESFAQRMGA
jgi:hypothetical protein